MYLLNLESGVTKNCIRPIWNFEVDCKLYSLNLDFGGDWELYSLNLERWKSIENYIRSI